MPLFFVLSGVVLSTNKDTVFFIIGKLKRLIGTYILFAIINTGFELMVDLYYKQNKTLKEIKSGIIDIVIISTKSRFNYLWFFPVMFWGIIISFLLIKYVKNYKFILLISVALLIMNQILVRNSVVSVYGIRESLYAQVFIVFGFYLKKIVEINNKLFIGLFFAILWLFGSYEWMINMNTTINYWDSGIAPISWTIFLALTGTFVVIFFSIACEKKNNSFFKVLEIIGKKSIYIYGIHQVFLVALHKINEIVKGTYLVKLFVYFSCVMLLSIASSFIVELILEKIKFSSKLLQSRKNFS